MKSGKIFVFIILYLLTIVIYSNGQEQDSGICTQNNEYQEMWVQAAERRAFRTSSSWNFTSLAVSPDGRTLAVANDGTVTLYDAETLEQRQQFPIGYGWYTFNVGWSPDSEILAFAGFILTSGETDPRSGLYIWNAEEGQLMFREMAEPLSMAWSPDSPIIAAIDLNDFLSLWDIGRRTQVDVPRNTPNGAGQFDTIIWSPNGSTLAAISQVHPPLVVWDLQDLDDPHTIELPYDTGGYIAWSPDGTQLAVGGWASTSIWILDMNSEEVVQTLDGSTGNVFEVQWSLDGTLLARGTQSGLFLWDMTSESTKPIRAFDENMPPFVRIAWLPDSQHLISVDFEGSIYRWDIETGCVEAAVLNEGQP
jgi:WD40 repeat protein